MFFILGFALVCSMGNKVNVVFFVFFLGTNTCQCIIVLIIIIDIALNIFLTKLKIEYFKGHTSHLHVDVLFPVEEVAPALVGIHTPVPVLHQPLWADAPVIRGACAGSRVLEPTGRLACARSSLVDFTTGTGDCWK